MLKPHEDLVLTLPEKFANSDYTELDTTVRALTPMQSAYVIGAIVEDWKHKGEHWKVTHLLNAIERRT